jgi:hypothetical protein
MSASGLVGCSRKSNPAQQDIPVGIRCSGSSQDLVGGHPTGYAVCRNGVFHRVTKQECPSFIPRPDRFSWAPNQYGPIPASQEDLARDREPCTSDSDCVRKPNGYCGWDPPLRDYHVCKYGCTRDEQCTSGQICLCQSPVGMCVRAACTRDADCPQSAVCAVYDQKPQCGPPAFACQTPRDTCAGKCSGDFSCAFDSSEDRWRCVRVACGI